MDRVDRVVSFGAIKDSTIVDAKQLPSGHTVALECAKRMPFGLHVTSIYMTAFFVVPFLARSRAEGGDRHGGSERRSGGPRSVRAGGGETFRAATTWNTQGPSWFNTLTTLVP